MFGLSELAVVLIVVTAALAAKKLPDLARSAGKATRVLKAEARALKHDIPAHENGPKVIRGETVPPAGTPGDGTGRP
ncbi:Sec-independent protein translocase TatA [Streptomyces ipomoeae]|jgi:sec-independent protein translocase protein TatA|uniref:MttA family protein n=2 Tax=Streptomyces ipomoeae TaxID=103232 RepID=L1KZU6_9ACTN|nr:twin-arginine translocase TatA/TatE family subunit [Streptomyces ipomoeae]EKX65863.1 MttA family protein [Streptomyces ipomoeae 91-03]MDX2700799.1 twin-arginine translocase TatA/TatE family subunit [Streptomyces ipomoeae]MDX2821597.1 twin-arginine translocase TatA/TatE family subunit [Streptomyces ipomoeae]MDX2846025.1 twin-arginine translocase TatA/TatE family subunit [Streptomyces ipomoeae]MDX2880987.1 twin-arginine translocase TatA/TatE family subunit [Streptomyces ipomoeae]